MRNCLAMIRSAARVQAYVLVYLLPDIAASPGWLVTCRSHDLSQSHLNSDPSTLNVCSNHLLAGL